MTHKLYITMVDGRPVRYKISCLDSDFDFDDFKYDIHR